MNLLSRLMPAHAAITEELEAARAADLQGLQNRVVVFQERFVGQSLQGKLAHLEREVKEVRLRPDDVTEWADVLILLLGAAEMQGLSAADLVRAAHVKMEVNERRQWRGPDSQGCYEYVREVGV